MRCAHRTGVERFAQPLDMDIDRAFLDEDVVAPDPVEQLVRLCTRSGWLSRKWSSLNSVAPIFTSRRAGDAVRRRIEPQRPDLDRVCRALPATSGAAPRGSAPSARSVENGLVR
jgi:hypothetical protein